MFDPDDIDAPDIFGDLGRDAMKVVGPLALLLFAPVLLLLAAFGGLPDAIETNAAPASAAEAPPDQFAVMQQVTNQTGIPWRLAVATHGVQRALRGRGKLCHNTRRTAVASAAGEY